MLFSCCGKNDFSSSYFAIVFSGHSEKIQCFQKSFEVFHFEKWAGRGSVCGATVAPLQIKLQPGLHFAGELLLSETQLWYLCRFVSFAVRERLHAGGSRQCAELADPRTGRIHSTQVSVRIEKYKWNSNLIHQRCVPRVLTHRELLLTPAGEFGLSHCPSSLGLVN